MFNYVIYVVSKKYQTYAVHSLSAKRAYFNLQI